MAKLSEDFAGYFSRKIKATLEHWAGSIPAFASLITNLKHFKTMDLFEYHETWPVNLRALLVAYTAKDQNYNNLIQLEKELKNIGYSIEYGLDCVAYNLQKIGPK